MIFRYFGDRRLYQLNAQHPAMRKHIIGNSSQFPKRSPSLKPDFHFPRAAEWQDEIEK
jgi:hypothetical protein